ncbi:MAG: glycosyltransferase involved in cell wall biosynthesis [Acidimicrobiales bacterium]|jgi:glycosyltransferase involved in cell wall biosynthesis
MKQIPEPKKILIATGLYPPDIGGPATYVRMLEEKLSEHGIGFTIVPFTHVRHLPKIVRHVVFFFKLIKKAYGTDAVYALDPISVGLPALVVSKIFRKPFLIRLGGDYAWEQGQQRFGLTQLLDEYTAHKKAAPWQVRTLAGVQSFVVCRATKVVVPSNYMKSIVATWGATEEQLQVIHSALFPLDVEQSRGTLRSELNYTGTVLFSAARLTPWKGFKVLLEVVAALVKEIPDISLVVAGDGPHMETLVEKTKQLEITDSVQFTGRLPKEELGKRLKASDLFVLNTAYEGLSHQLLEAMHLGVPIVTTNVGGNPELVQDGISGLTVPYDDAQALKVAIQRVIQGDELRTRLIAQARVRTKDFNQDNVVEQFVSMMNTQVWQKK